MTPIAGRHKPRTSGPPTSPSQPVPSSMPIDHNYHPKQDPPTPFSWSAFGFHFSSKLPFEFFRLPIRILPASMPPRSIGFCQPPLPSPHSSSSAFPSVSRTVLFYLSRSFPLALPVEPFRPPPFLWLANYSHSIYLHPFPVHSLYANS
jgi:hypothetical protein